MLVPLEWLKEYVDFDADFDTFCERMILSGSNIEGVRHYCADAEKIVVGKILSVEKHENSDHLVVTRVDAGGTAPLRIVTGASNVAEGDFVPVALVGGVLPGGVKIKKSKLRGVESEGMLCSASELGFEDKVIPVSHKDGIWILEKEYEVGADFVEVAGLRTRVIDFEITPNRPDCLSVIGMAREAAAVFDCKRGVPNTKMVGRHGNKAEDFISVEIRRPDLCLRYIARVITDVKIAPSPWWLQKKLMLAGMRPINNIVDVTNYVMLEYGHPLHAFDIRTIEGGRIIVDTAEEGESFTTLDGTARTLSADMLMIKDAAKAVGVAGVMGGLNSEVAGDTKTILIECAAFDADAIRLTSRKLGLRTEASARYEKGISPELAGEAAERVCALAEQIGAGYVTEGAVDVYPARSARLPAGAGTVPSLSRTVAGGALLRARIELRVARAHKVLGARIGEMAMASYLRRLEMDVREMPGRLEVLPPHVRLDIKGEEDLIEEIARIHGYDKLESTLHRGNSRATVSRAAELRDLARETLIAAGYSEIQTYSFVSPRGVDDMDAPASAKERRFVRLLNPLGEENSVMRTTLLPAMLEVLGRNYSRNNERVAAFEIGNTFFGGGERRLPEERIALSMGAYGDGMDFFRMKGALELLFGRLGIQADYEAERAAALWHPGRCARVFSGGTHIGTFGELHPDKAAHCGVGTRCCIAEFDMAGLIEKADIERAYAPLPRYPAAERDIALIVREDVAIKRIEDVIRGAGGHLLERARLFDVYRGPQVADGMKSAAFNLIYRSPERTLTDEEVSAARDKLLAALERELGAVLRDA
ncbi:MAG: phenylalanine--tRNA ligase subunit beta [Clostridiales Family XIII bacterium]|jgi:phenylalanyl-tRNA synthetase beta chain|nr:phenylalanine--tRNA ligase subunit beta [Clostridiales Family XIII bacterium]